MGCMAEKGFLSLLFVTGSATTRKLIIDALPQQTLRERNVGGYKFCGTGAEALDEFMFNFPDIVFIDEALPDLHGKDLLCKLHADDPNAFLVFLASNITSKQLTDLIEKGVKGVITKPFSPTAFDRYIQYFFKEKYKKSWDEVEAFSDKGQVKR